MATVPACLAVVVTVVASVLTACGGETRIDPTDAEDYVGTEMENRFEGFDVTGVDCPGDVEARIGTVFECEVEGDRSLLVVLRVTGEDGTVDPVAIRPAA